MRVLAIESSGTSGSVAALAGCELLAEHGLPAGQRSAQSLAPAIDMLLQHVGWQPREVELVAVTQGPGSFTGLRIGVTTAKAFAYAVSCPVMGVNTLEVIARRLPSEIEDAHVVLDAQREELFFARFHRQAATWHETTATHLIAKTAWLAGLKVGDVVGGPGLKRLFDRLPEGVVAVDPRHWDPTAAEVGRAGLDHFTSGRRDDVFQLVPHYFRRTAAEEQWERLGRK